MEMKMKHIKGIKFCNLPTFVNQHLYENGEPHTGKLAYASVYR